jgi:hypothetical protein
MRNKRTLGHSFARPAVVALAAAWSALAGNPGRATAQEDKLVLLVSYDLKATPEAKPSIALRPNLDQHVYLFLKNAGQDRVKGAAVSLVEVRPDGSTRTLAKADVKAIPGGEHVPIVFDKPAAAPAPDKAAPAPDKPAPVTDLTGPPVRLQLWVSSPGAKEPAKTDLRVEIMAPREYVSIKDKARYDAKTRRFTVTVKGQPTFIGSPAPVKLVLSPDVIPGLIDKRTSGVYSEMVTGPNDEVELVANDIQFRGDAPPPYGLVYLTVDDYQRAFIFVNTFQTSGSMDELAGTHARIRAPHFAAPGAKFPVRVEVDNPPSGPGRIEFAFDRTGTGRFHPQPLPGYREQQVSLLPAGPQGGLFFRTRVRDWTKDLDTTEVYGERQLRVQLFNIDKKEFIPLAQDPELEEGLLKNRDALLAPLKFDKDAVFADVVLDGTKPAGVDFVGWPTQLLRGTPLVLKATGDDPESGIRKVTFFLGKPEGGKVPTKAVTASGKQFKTEEKVWQAELPLETEKPGRFVVSVEFTNNAGLSETKTVVIQLVDAPKGAAKKIVGATIKGTVFQGNLNPPGVAMSLIDDKGNVKAGTTTNPKGQYMFQDVPPGSYRVVAVRTAAMTQGQTPVLVPEGKELIEKVDVRISR